MVVTIEKGYHKIKFFTMEKKKATWSYNRKRSLLVVSIEKGYHKTNFFTIEEKKATGSYARKRPS